MPREAPSELYSNSTVAVDIETGKLKWYYQHLPGDDWDLDHVHERTRGEVRNVVVSVGEAGGIWVLDRATGQFIWATPFPLDVPEFHISKIDVDTGRTHINWDKVKKHDGDRILVCFHNTRSFWSTAYHPGKNALYIPHSDACLDMTENFKIRPASGRAGKSCVRGRIPRSSLRSPRSIVDRQGRHDPFAAGAG